ncbi:putative E3 ubiquitin-protein ligase HERC2 [Monoraphidium neglectum]|uniref:Putative E3 ubiquitin-protein ligase HERC2 n=1 Tax=Monoraphidium neglectum TaxID=145388 RepID=A0A0D2LPY4_9CHLO|nr:putative E3 ubiquitin-protein ligase HERC2 [Monoraphidium neglectum]KIY92016.1 putative E3 ubiquitin-protein ligase HERC2 [Monoraphidium neglectum]|eukprot:XP_013891036.1 putative E3 ubiquitin-protein ligase HERC2 [Monoraphidium neglectum]
MAAAVLQAPLLLPPLPASKSSSGLLAGAAAGAASVSAVVPGRVSGVLGFPARREIGDCYIWGGWSGEDGRLSGGSARPVLLHHTHTLDVIQVAASGAPGAQHAALLTRGGEVYTWGSGAGGKLGHGTSSSVAAPQQVVRLFGKGAVAVACGHTYTAAVLRDGGLYTWGTGLGGQLGLGEQSGPTQLWPARVHLSRPPCPQERVESVACGPYHLAAISSAGVLYTWGDGLFGKLGHGSHDSCAAPRAVDALRGSRVVGVSCGWWHTAAVAVPRGGGGVAVRQRRRTAGGSRAGAGSSGSDADASDSSAAGDGGPRGGGGGDWGGGGGGCVGGALFTWGGDFTWQLRGKRDHHHGCLGHGDLAGRLVPTQVLGEDDVRQVVCGRNFTVALNGIGQVLQMGSTGAVRAGPLPRRSGGNRGRPPNIAS